MSWWSDVKTEPYRQFRFKVSFQSLGIESYHVMKADKPMFKVGEYSHKVYNHQFNYPGRLVWDPITITVVDMPGGAQASLTAALEAAGYVSPSVAAAQNATDGLSKFSATSALGTVTMTQMKAQAGGGATGGSTHADGDVWTLHNAFLTDVKFGSLDYGSEDAVQIQMTIRYDWAQYNAAQEQAP